MWLQIQITIYVTHCIGGTLIKKPKSNISVVEDGQDYSDSPSGHDPESPETNPEEASKVEQKAGPETPLAPTIDSLKPREDEHHDLFNHNMEAEGSEDPKINENNQTALEGDSAQPVSYTETNKKFEFEEKPKSKTNTFEAINFESLLVKKELTMQKQNNTKPNPKPMNPTESHNSSKQPSDVEHGQDYGNSVPDNGPESKLKANHLDGKGMKEEKAHK